MIIETFQVYFSISSFGRKHEGSFYNVLASKFPVHLHVI